MPPMYLHPQSPYNTKASSKRPATSEHYTCIELHMVHTVHIFISWKSFTKRLLALHFCLLSTTLHFFGARKHPVVLVRVTSEIKAISGTSLQAVSGADIFGKIKTWLGWGGDFLLQVWYFDFAAWTGQPDRPLWFFLCLQWRKSLRLLVP